MLMSTNPKSDYNKMKENVVIVDITSHEHYYYLTLMYIIIAFICFYYYYGKINNKITQVHLQTCNVNYYNIFFHFIIVYHSKLQRMFIFAVNNNEYSSSL
jgi:hypothetical protein